MKEWNNIKLKNIIAKIIDNRGKSAPISDNGIYPIIEINAIGGFYPDYSKIRKYVSSDIYNSWFRAGHPEENDILIPTVGTIGITSMMDKTQACIAQNLIALRLCPDVNPLYVYYFLKSDYTKQHLINLNIGGVQPSIKVPHLLELSIPLPKLKVQNAIANILHSIDQKIELNRQINDNLEQQASSLLSDWISTYPCRTYKLSDICKYANAKCETGNLTPQNYISTENMLPNKKGIVEASNIPTGKATWYKVDDILIANIRPYFQKIWKADINGGCSADVLCIRANIESHSPILYWLLHQDAFFEYVMTGAKGCKMPRGDKQHIMNWSIDLPEVQYWADLATQLGSIDQQIAYNRIESINLSNLRDTLLPKLMSGEIKINEIDC